MHFLVLAYDGTDEAARDRRLAARAAHLALFQEMVEKGVFLFGTAILDEAGAMVGSMIVCDFPSQAELESQWLSHEPYVVGDVWRKVEVLPAQVPPFLRAGRVG
jgi:uncharacterized protein